eukprot:1158705-Pelagomonas_calceolata.AAC.13
MWKFPANSILSYFSYLFSSGKQTPQQRGNGVRRWSGWARGQNLESCSFLLPNCHSVIWQCRSDPDCGTKVEVLLMKGLSNALLSIIRVPESGATVTQQLKVACMSRDHVVTPQCGRLLP